MKLRIIIGLLVVILLGAAALSACYPPVPATSPPTLDDFYAVLKTKQFVDLTHAFEPGIPHWPGFPDEERETIYWYDEGVGTLGAGFYA